MPPTSTRTLIFCNVSRVPFSNNVMPIVDGFRSAGPCRVVDTLRIGLIQQDGGPVLVPDEVIDAELSNFPAAALIFIGGGLHPSSKCRDLGKTVIGIALSDPLRIDTSRSIANHFTHFYTQDPASLERYAGLESIVRVCDIDMDTQRYRPMLKRKRHDIIFFGRHSAYRAKVIASLRKRFDVAVYSYSGQPWGFETRPTLRSPRKLAEAICRSRLCLETALLDFGDVPHDYWRITYRPHFAAACGVPTLIEHDDAVARYYDPGREIATWRNLDELLEKAAQLLGSPLKRQVMGYRARRRAVRCHDWRRKATELLSQCR
jgi:glycosyltransferase involved in cell wall biosynthesis